MRSLWPWVSVAVLGCSQEYRAHSTHVHDTDLPVLQRVPVVESFVQTGEGEVDVLWLVDDSFSMDDEQAALAEYFPAFHEYFEFSGLEYHIGVISTDMDNPMRSGRLVDVEGVRYIDTETPDARTVFEKMALLGTKGSFMERGLDAVHTALTTRLVDHNAGFLREESDLHVIVVSDEADFSTGVTADELADFLLSLGTTRERVTFSSIVPSDTAYVHVTERVGGMHLPIHDEDWHAVLEQLGVEASGMAEEFFLEGQPIPTTLDVAVEYRGELRTFLAGDDWVYRPEHNSILFLEYVPPPFAEVRVSYDPMESEEA